MCKNRGLPQAFDFQTPKKSKIKRATLFARIGRPVQLPSFASLIFLISLISGRRKCRLFLAL